MSRLATALVFLVPFAVLSVAEAGYPIACPDGAYLVAGPALLPGPGASAGDAVVVAQGTVAIRSGCPPVPARIRGLRSGGVALVAKWPACGSAQRVRLLARIGAGCTRMEGRIFIGRPALSRAFTAARCADADACPPMRCVTNGDCSPTDFCAKAAGECDAEGVCRMRPGACPDVYEPVCGCDGVTYGNACEAAAAGVNSARTGVCEEVCGGIRGLPCGAGEFCELPAGTCDSADLEGVCVAAPTACPDVYKPVCGCDGITYGNDCERRAAQTQKSHDGPCAAKCETHCDCYGNPSLEFRDPCPLLCPDCGNFWTCEQGLCVEHCGRIPPQLPCP